MSEQLPDLESLRCFAAAASRLNFRAAARDVGLTPAALGQRIRGLEELWGVRLFERTTRKVSLTESGLSLLPSARRTLSEASACGPAARGELGPPPMELTLGTRHELGLSWILPMLPDLEAAQPGLSVHLYFGSGQDLEMRLGNREIDCAVSSRDPRDPRIEGLRLHREDYVLVAAPEALSERPLREAADAAQHLLVDIAVDRPLYRYFAEAPDAPRKLEFAGLRRMGTIAAVRDCVLACRGVAVLPLYLVRPELSAGRLVRLFPDVELLFDHFRLLFRVDDPRRAVYETLAERMGGVALR